MTRHKSPEERIQEIVSAALNIIDERGLGGVTMEAVVARTSLSKGGVYRLVRNREELLRRVFDRIVAAFRPLTLSEALGWGLPLKPTILKLLLSPFQDEEGLRLRRVHIRLKPHLPTGDAAVLDFEEKLRAILDAYAEIIGALLRRDGVPLRSGHEEALRQAVVIGQSLFDGLILDSLGGLPLHEVERRMSAYIDLVLAGLTGRPLEP